MEDGSSPSMGLIVFILLIVVEFIFYGFGTAIQQLNEHLIEEQAEDGDKKARKLLHLIRQPMHFVNTVQIISALTGIIIGYYELHRFRTILSDAVLSTGWSGNEVMVEWIATIIIVLFICYLIVTIGVTVPKGIAGKSPEKWAYRLVNVMYGMTFLFRPFTYVIGASVHLVLKLFGIDSKAAAEDVTEEGIISMVNEGHEKGVLEDSEAEMIHNIFELGEKDASDIMTHRKHIIALNKEDTLSEALEFILEQSYSRFPVYEGDIDNIVGILHLKDAMKCHRRKEFRDKQIGEIKELIWPVSFIPETRHIDLLFQNMQAKKMHMAIVVDEYGQTAGLVAMEDILEEIVGNILDEYDEDENFIVHLEDGSYLVDGMTPLEELEEVTGLELDDEDYETLNGFLISELDRIPNEGEQIEIQYDGYLFKILSVENKMIKNVKMIKLQEHIEEDEE